VLRDCYGPQQLLRDGLLPAELVLGHPEFLRACHGWQPLGQQWLHLYAADVGRDPQGRFRVFSDRTQAPTGAGYALENRLVLGRTLPELFREYRVERVATFFNKLRRTVESLASCCFRRVRATKAPSSTPTWRATSATSWSRAAT
jgi:uncharacterized circularly permuted ATP-grasp superfamily protein